MKKQNIFFLCLASLFFIISISSSQSNASIVPIGKGPYVKATPFWVEIKVGDPVPVTDLYGISFKIKSKGNNILYVDGSAVPGTFLGEALLSFFQKVDSQTVDIAVSKTSPPSANGNGVVAKAQFIGSDVGIDTIVLLDVVAVNQFGEAIQLDDSLLILTINSVPEKEATLKPKITIPVKKDSSFWVAIEIGDPDTVSDLYGISFKIKSDKSTAHYLDGSGEKGDFLGNNVLTFFQKVDSQTVDVAITKTSEPGANGKGIIAKVKFLSTTSGQITFFFEDIVAINSAGAAIPIHAESLTITADSVVIQVTPATLKPSVTSQIMKDSLYWIDMIIGDPDTVSDLYGISFKIKSNTNSTTYLDGSGEKGTFLGNNVLTFFHKVDSQTVDAAITKTSPPGISGSGLVAKLKFISHAEGGVVFSIDDITAVNSKGATIPIHAESLLVSVKSNQAPLFLRTLPDTTISENQLLDYIYQGSDPENQQLTFDLLTGPIGLTLSTTGVLQWVPGFTQSGIHQIIVSLTDGFFEVKDTALVTVINTNRKPSTFIFVEPLIDTIKYANIFIPITFTKSFDPDNDSLQYYIQLNDTTIITNDTSISFPSSKLMANTNYTISGYVADGFDTVSALNIKHFVTVLMKVYSSDEIIPKYSLFANYPNPFNPQTTLRYGIPQSSKVKLTIYNTLGQVIETMIDEQKDAGYYEAQWNATNHPSGVYFYRIEAIATDNSRNRFVETKKMLLLK